VGDDVHAPGNDIAGVGGLAALRPGERFDVLRPAPARLEHPAPDAPLLECQDVRVPLVDIWTLLIGLGKPLDMNSHDDLHSEHMPPDEGSRNAGGATSRTVATAGAPASA